MRVRSNYRLYMQFGSIEKIRAEITSYSRTHGGSLRSLKFSGNSLPGICHLEKEGG